MTVLLFNSIGGLCHMSPGKIGGNVNVRHLFGGISAANINLKQSAENNLKRLLEEFKRLGIHIDPSCRIANSTLIKLVETINSVLTPVNIEFDELAKILLRGARLSKETEGMVEDLSETQRTRNFNISIGPGVILGEDIYISHSVKIGARTTIGNKTKLLPFVEIGNDCIISQYVHLNLGCKLGDNVSVVDDDTTFPEHLIVPPNSVVKHKSPDSTMAMIIPRMKTL